jgi:regulation of enolase protein 1 (concanavalin A-like superfamily)
MQLAPDHLLGSLRLAQWFEKTPHTREAIIACQDAIRINPTLATLHLLLGRLFESQERKSDAAEEYKMASKLEPESTAASDALQRLSSPSAAAKVAEREVLFTDSFHGAVQPGWSWVREHREAWRITPAGLEVRVEPGNMWGPQNNAKNVLLRPARLLSNGSLEISVSVTNNPTHQYEQVDLVWFCDESNMVKIGQELVDGKLSVVMGREENDKTQTIAIVPLQSTRVRLRLSVTATQIAGQFSVPPEGTWRDAGTCSRPCLSNEEPMISLQFYQGAPEAEHWAKVSNFEMVRKR